MKLVTNSLKNYHVSQDTVNEFEKVILSDKHFSSTGVHAHRYITKASYLLWRTKMKFFSHSKHPVMKVPSGRNENYGDARYFCVFMGVKWEKCFPYFLLPGRKSIYLFDSWPDQHKNIARFVNSFKIDRVFVSSSNSALQLQSMVASSVITWIPEGLNPELYRQKSYEGKDIDVLALGRRYNVYHDSIVAALNEDGRTYLYEKIKGVIIFPTREAFIDGLARTKISVCVPSSITHPERSGSIETLTVRYLQSMISKCLVLGHAPQEMVGLFGYNPVIEIDMNDPVGQIRQILEHFTDYIPLIERNYNAVLQDHTWSRRWEKICGIIG